MTGLYFNSLRELFIVLVKSRGKGERRKGGKESQNRSGFT
jgi:hypothetical protein